MADDEYRAFLADVAERGILVPLEVTASGVVLDGRHRHRAARELNLTEVPVRVVSPRDPVEHMLGAALYRRQLTQSQRAAIVIELEEHREAQAAAAARRRAGQNHGATLPQGRTRELTARRVGVSPRLLQDAACVKAADPVLFERVKEGALPVHRAAKRVRREQKLRNMTAPPPLPAGPFDVLYADPPWPSQSPEADWSPEQHYPTMPVEEIKALPVPAAEDAALFLWAVNGQLQEALEVMRAWGFTYKAKLTWVKPSIGLGHWVRYRDEVLLIGTRGKFPLPDEADRPDSVVEAPRRRHSEKPAVFYELIERMYPDATRVELFARSEWPGWVAWGNEVAA
jgi:N6-adenosine-specific RNA methylase IME4